MSNSNELLDEVFNNLNMRRMVIKSFLIFFISVIAFLPKIYFVGKNYYANKKYYIVTQDYDILSNENIRLQLTLKKKKFLVNINNGHSN